MTVAGESAECTESAPLLLPHVPPEPLRPFVAAAFGYRAPTYPAGVHRGMPSPHLTLVVELLTPLRVEGPVSSVAAHGVVGGLHTSPAIIDASRPQEGLQYALSPLAAHGLFGVSAAPLRNEVVDLVEILGSRAQRVMEQIHAAAGWTERFGLLDDALLARVHDRGTVVPPQVTEAWRLIMATHGSIPVAEVAAHVDWGRRYLGERFRAVTGLTPKEAARIARFERAHHLLRGTLQPPLVQIAIECGYADQAHLAREWRALTGDNISTWLREELPFVQDAGSRGPAHSGP